MRTLAEQSGDQGVADGQTRDFVSRYPGSVLWWLEDDLELCRLLYPRLRSPGWELQIFHRAEPLLAALQAGGRPDLLLLDRRLPKCEGLELLRELRGQDQTFPVLLLSALASPADRILGLEAGAQDYLTKPFHARELLLRCEHLLRSDRRAAICPSAREQLIRLGSVSFQPHEGILEHPATGRVTLSRGERALLLALCRAPNRVLTREQIAQACGSLVPVHSSRSIDMRLSRLRRLLQLISDGNLQIETVRAQGYALRIGQNTRSGPEPG